MHATLPHTYPFRFVDAGDRLGPGSDDGSPWQGSVTARIAADSWAARAGEISSPMILAEAIAQAALLLEGGDPEIGRSGFLAGIDHSDVMFRRARASNARLLRHPGGLMRPFMGAARRAT